MHASHLRLFWLRRCGTLQERRRHDESEQDGCHVLSARVAALRAASRQQLQQDALTHRRSRKAQSCFAGEERPSGVFIARTHRHPHPLESHPPKFVGPSQPPPYTQRSFISQKLYGVLAGAASPLFLEFWQSVEKHGVLKGEKEHCYMQLS